MELHETYTPWSRSHDGVLLYLTLCRHAGTQSVPADGSNLDAHHDRESIVDAHAVEFSKTVKPLAKVLPSEETHLAPRPRTLPGQPSSIAKPHAGGGSDACRPSAPARRLARPPPRTRRRRVAPRRASRRPGRSAAAPRSSRSRTPRRSRWVDAPGRHRAG